MVQAGRAFKAVKTPTFTLTYEGVDISRDLAELLGTLTYTDRLHAQSPDLEIAVENRDRRWMDKWLPAKGDEALLVLGYEGELELDCGRFEFDDADFAGPPDRVTLGFLATDVTADLRTERTEPYEKTTLRAIAEDIAKRHNLELVGEVPEVKIDRATQNEETDLQFITKLAEEYDLVVKVENRKLIFYSWDELDARPIIATLTDADIKSYRIPWKSDSVYKQATLTYQDPKTKKEITHTEVDPEIEVGDTLKVNDRVESQAQAIEKCKAALKKANRKQVEPSIDLVEGVSWAIAGANVEVNGYGLFSGKYQITEAKHTMNLNRGWDCSLKLRKIERIRTSGGLASGEDSQQ